MGSNLLVSTQVAYSSEHTETEGLLPSQNDNSPVVPGGTLVSLRQVQGSQTPGALPSRSSKEWTARLREVNLIQFLKECYTNQYTDKVANWLIKAYRESTEHQGDSNWRHFQRWLPPEVTSISTTIVLEFLIYLLEDHRLSPSTVGNYRCRLRLPLAWAFDIDTNAEVFSMLGRSMFLAKPPPKRKTPQWSLDAVLKLLSTQEFDRETASSEKLLMKTLFLSALASGNRVSELAAVIRQGLSLSHNRAVSPLLLASY